MKANILCLLSVVLFINTIICQPAWIIHDAPVNEDFVSLSFIDENSGWIVSSAGTIASTMDGGNSWTTHSYPEYHFESVHFSTLDIGCIVGWHVLSTDSSLILITSDGGNAWIEPEYPKVTRLNDVYFANSSSGWAVGSKEDFNLNCCLHTGDGGQNWSAQMDIYVAGAELKGVHFRDLLTGVVCGNDGAFFHTNSGGSSGWALNISMPLENLNGVCNTGDIYGCAVGNNGLALYTVNDWYQHIDMNTGTQESLMAVSADPGSNKLWAVGMNGTIIHCQSYILGWSNQFSGTTDNLNDICMLGESSGWAVGDNGTILQYTDAISIPEHSIISMTVIPNPGAGIFVLQFNRTLSIDRIEVIDIFGKVSRAFFPEKLTENYTIDVSESQNGFYFLKVYSGNTFCIQRLVLNH